MISLNNPTKSDIKALETKWTKIITIFLYISVIWECGEGGTSIYFGYKSGHISLFAFGIVSLIEIFSAGLVLYHVIFDSFNSNPQINDDEKTPLLINDNDDPESQQQNKSTLFSLETERKLTLFIGALLIIFCIFACFGGIARLIQGTPPSDTIYGIIIAGISIIAMFIMWYFKTKASVILNSSTLASDAACSLGCIKLSTVLALGSILWKIWPILWWVDAVTAIIIGLFVGYDGYKTIKNAKDREKFKGGCVCCGATDSGLAKYFRENIEEELDQGQNPSFKVEEDKCCGGCKSDEDNKKKEDDCCGGCGRHDEEEELGCCKDDDDKGSNKCEKDGCCSS